MKKLGKLSDDIHDIYKEDIFDTLEKGSSSKSSPSKFKAIQTTIETIVDLHRRRQHDDALRESTSYLKTLHDGQKDKLCKSSCNIAQRIKNSTPFFNGV